MALVMFNSNRVIDGKGHHPGETADVEDWRPLVESGAASLAEPLPYGDPDATVAGAEDAPPADTWPSAPVAGPDAPGA